MSHNLLALVSNFRPVGRATFTAASFSLIQSRFICFPESICIFPLGCFVSTASQSEQRAHLSRTFLVSSAWCWTVVGFTPHCCTMTAIRQLLETVSSTLPKGSMDTRSVSRHLNPLAGSVIFPPQTKDSWVRPDSQGLGVENFFWTCRVRIPRYPKDQPTGRPTDQPLRLRHQVP